MIYFHEDMIFKNVSKVRTGSILHLLGLNIESKILVVRTDEIRCISPKSFHPDTLIELDKCLLVIEYQSTAVDDEFSKRGLVYLSLIDSELNLDKPIFLLVLSTAEESSEVHYESGSVKIDYLVVGFEKYDSEEIINNIEYKIENNQELTDDEVIELSLLPVINKKNKPSECVKIVSDILMRIEGLDSSLESLVYGIEWLLADKFISDDDERESIQSFLGDKMTAIFEYGNRREEEGMKEGIRKVIFGLSSSGMGAGEIADRSGLDLSYVEELLASR